MALTQEWHHRLLHWTRELPEHFVQTLGSAELEGFTTDEQLTADEAFKRSFEPRPVGTRWAKTKWDLAWHRTTVTAPDEAAGRKLILAPGVANSEGLVFVNGVARGVVGSLVKQPFFLSFSAAAGETFDVLIESYAGNHPRNCCVGAVPLDRDLVPEYHPESDPAIGETTFGLWVDDAWELYVDVKTLWELADKLDQSIQFVAEIHQGLMDFTLIADFELPRDDMLATFRAARERLAPLLARRNPDGVPELHAIGHGHLDAAWLWPLAETRRKMARTLSHQLTLAELFPDHKFQQSQPAELNMLREDHPELFARVQQGAADGNIVVDGASWVEPDCNVTGGESLVRQFIHGKAFIAEHFGVDSRMFWVPDSFGFSGAIPQIMAGCGVDYFTTGKLYWSYHGGEPFPHGIFTWEGIDGTQVLAEMLDGYNNQTSPENTYNNWAARRTQDARVDQRIFPFGEGDGGAGPGFPHLAFASRQKDLYGLPKFVPMAPGESFDRLAEKTSKPGGLPLPVYAGELYFQCHRGTLTSQAKTKLGNRLAEISLREVEMWASAALAVGKDFDFPAGDMAGAWQTLLLNQFHDILPGSSIERVHAEAEAAFESVCLTARDVADRAVAAFVDEGCPDESLGCLTVLNSLSWDRPVLVELSADWPGAAADGNALPLQRQNGHRVVEVDVPSCGWTTITKADGADSQATDGPVATDRSLENEHLAVAFNDLGQITSLVDKATGREFIARPEEVLPEGGADIHPGGLGNELKLYKDVPTDFDAWDIDSMYEFLPVPLESAAEIELVSAGPLLATLRVTRTINDSQITQLITLRRGSRRLDFHTVVDWNERHKLLKVGFDTNLRAHDALHEIQFGYLPRPTHRSRQFDADRFEVCNHKWTALAEANRGLAVVNDCKYGVNVLGGQINLTLLKSAMAPDKNADRGRQEFTYSLFVWDDCSFFDSGLTRSAYDLNIPPSVAEGSPADGLETTRSMFAVDAPNIIIEAVKPAEDGSGDLIVRLFDAARQATTCTLSTSLPVKSAAETNMLEAPTGELALKDGAMALEFRAFEIKTVRLKV